MKLISYNKKFLSLRITIGKYIKILQCPFMTWWKARKYFKRPKFKVYFGPMFKYRGKKNTKFGEFDDYDYKGGYWPFASTDYLKWHTPKWFPIHIASTDICWKDKYNSPRYEFPGYFIIFFGRNYRTHWQFSIVPRAPKIYCCNDCTREDMDVNYWESILWYLHYADEYNPETKKRNLLKARETMRKEHWSNHKTYDLKDAEILKFGPETLTMGNNTSKDFLYVDLKCDELYNKLYDVFKYPMDNLRSDDSVCIDIRGTKPKEENGIKIGQDIFQSSSYVKLVLTNTEDETEYKFIRVYFTDKNSNIYNYLQNKDELNIIFKYKEQIDLGPSFKDDILTEKAIEKIKKYHYEH